MIEALTRLRVAVVVAIAVAAACGWRRGRAPTSTGRAAPPATSGGPTSTGRDPARTSSAARPTRSDWRSTTSTSTGRTTPPTRSGGPTSTGPASTRASSPAQTRRRRRGRRPAHLLVQRLLLDREANLDGSAVNLSLISGAIAPLTWKIGVAVDGQHASTGRTSPGRRQKRHHDRAGRPDRRRRRTSLSRCQRTVRGCGGRQHVYWTNRGSETIGRADLMAAADRPSSARPQRLRRRGR